jgi:hypothetical protein
MKLGELLEGGFFTEYIKKGTIPLRYKEGDVGADRTQGIS